MDSREAVLFQSPPSLEREFELPNSGKLSGMAIPRGITLIVGGGFHGTWEVDPFLVLTHPLVSLPGKSTLLEALQVGIYNKIPGDGREFVATDPDAVTVLFLLSSMYAEVHLIYRAIDQGRGWTQHRERQYLAVYQ